MQASQTGCMRDCAPCQCRDRYCPTPNGDPVDVLAVERPCQSRKRLAGVLHSMVTSRLTHSLLLLSAAVGNALMLGAIDYLNELAAPLADLTEALAVHAVSTR